MQKYTDCFLYFQANCLWSHIVCFLTKMFHSSNETWCIIHVRSPSTITQKFIYEFNLVTSTPKICKNTAVKIFPVHVGFRIFTFHYQWVLQPENWTLYTNTWVLSNNLNWTSYHQGVVQDSAASSLVVYTLLVWHLMGFMVRHSVPRQGLGLMVMWNILLAMRHEQMWWVVGVSAMIFPSNCKWGWLSCGACW